MTVRFVCKSEDVDFLGMLYYTLNLFHTTFEKDNKFNDLNNTVSEKKPFMGNHI